MKKMTSAYANKLLRSLEDEKNYYLRQEAESSTYVASVDEEPVIPEYDYAKCAAKIEELDIKTSRIRHALNLHNSNSVIEVSDTSMSIDTILVRMSQLSKRKQILDGMRKQLPKSREASVYSSRKTVPEYRYINYDLELVKSDYEKVSGLIMEMQLALDRFNQTVEFEVDI